MANKRTPRQKRQALGRKMAKKLPQKGKATDTVLSGAELRALVRELSR